VLEGAKTPLAEVAEANLESELQIISSNYHHKAQKNGYRKKANSYSIKHTEYMDVAAAKSNKRFMSCRQHNA
jgi:hypothetical protein